MNIVTELINTALQIFIFTLIPFIFYFIKRKTPKGFFNYIGITKSNKRANNLALVACLLLAGPLLIMTMISQEFKEIMLTPDSITRKFRDIGFSVNSLSLLLIIAILKTSFAEEVFFRGFIAKILIKKIGFRIGNVTQALIFGIMHLVLFITLTSNLFFLIVIFITPTLGAYVSVILNENYAGGSIIPGWISHATANILSYSVIGFLMQ